MLKKLILSVLALGLTSIALADGNTISESSELAAVPNDTFDPGLYLGIQGGFGASGWKKIDGDIAKVNNADGLAGRAVIGYDFTENWAMELGYMY